MKRLTFLAVVLVGCTSSDGTVETTTAASTTTAVTTTSAESPSSGSVPVATAAPRDGDARVLLAGSYGAAASGAVSGRRAPFVLIARDVDEYARLWKEHVGNEPMPTVDFSRDWAIFLLMGPQSTGGYSIEFHEAERDGDRLRVNATLHHPSDDAITTQAFTAPFVVFAIRDRGFRSVEWMNEGRLLARTDLAN